MTVNTNGLATVMDDAGIPDAELVVKQAEQREKALEKVLAVAVKRTNSQDWVDQDGRPYLQASGAEKIAPLFGVRITNVRHDREVIIDDIGTYYIYTYTGTFAWAFGSFEVVGTRSTRDQLFGRNSKAKRENNEGEWKPVHEVDETDVKKAAYSNMMARGISTLLGIRNRSWEEIEAMGVKRDSVNSVKYQSSGVKSDENVTPEILAMRKELRFLVLKLSGDDSDTAKKTLNFLTQFESNGKTVPGKSRVEELSDKALPVTLKKAKAEFLNRGLEVPIESNEVPAS